jgi:hypothetical protein
MDFLKRHGGSDVEMSGLTDAIVRARLQNSQDNIDKKNARGEISEKAVTTLKQFELRRRRRLQNDIQEALKNNEDLFCYFFRTWGCSNFREPPY